MIEFVTNIVVKKGEKMTNSPTNHYGQVALGQ
jgi:hypothetical protein